MSSRIIDPTTWEAAPELDDASSESSDLVEPTVAGQGSFCEAIDEQRNSIVSFAENMGIKKGQYGSKKNACMVARLELFVNTPHNLIGLLRHHNSENITQGDYMVYSFSFVRMAGLLVAPYFLSALVKAVGGVEKIIYVPGKNRTSAVAHVRLVNQRAYELTRNFLPYFADKLGELQAFKDAIGYGDRSFEVAKEWGQYGLRNGNGFKLQNTIDLNVQRACFEILTVFPNEEFKKENVGVEILNQLLQNRSVIETQNIVGGFVVHILDEPVCLKGFTFRKLLAYEDNLAIEFNDLHITAVPMLQLHNGQFSLKESDYSFEKTKVVFLTSDGLNQQTEPESQVSSSSMITNNESTPFIPPLQIDQMPMNFTTMNNPPGYLSASTSPCYSNPSPSMPMGNTMMATNPIYLSPPATVVYPNSMVYSVMMSYSPPVSTPSSQSPEMPMNHSFAPSRSRTPERTPEQDDVPMNQPPASLPPMSPTTETRDVSDQMVYLDDVQQNMTMGNHFVPWVNTSPPMNMNVPNGMASNGFGPMMNLNSTGFHPITQPMSYILVNTPSPSGFSEQAPMQSTSMMFPSGPGFVQTNV